MAELSWAYWLTFDGLSAAPQVRVPSTQVSIAVDAADAHFRAHLAG
jgi:hypothetical protein